VKLLLIYIRKKQSKVDLREVANTVETRETREGWPPMTAETTGRQLPPLSSVLYGIISGRRSVLAA
jgi:hypothetical protein